MHHIGFYVAYTNGKWIILMLNCEDPYRRLLQLSQENILSKETKFIKSSEGIRSIAFHFV
jgi:hypothetical protein